VGAHEGCSDFVAELVDVLVGAIVRGAEEELLRDGVAVGVEAVGGKGEEAIAFADGFSGEKAGTADDACEEAGEFVLGWAVEGWGFGGFSAEEGAAVGFAGVDEATDDLGDDVGVEAAGGEEVEEEERCCALDGDVVDAVVDKVGADGGVQAELAGKLELGTDAFGGRDEDGVREALGVEREEAGGAADFGEDVFVEGAASEAFDAVVGEEVAVAGGGGRGVKEVWV
jgi:hypothetical protein